MLHMLKNQNKNQAKEMKLISDIVFGWDLGKISWTTSLVHWKIVLKLFKNNFIVLRKERLNVALDQINSLIGYAFLVPVKVKSEEELIKYERRCSHFEKWKLLGKKQFFYLSEVILHSEYRNSKEFINMFNMIINYCENNNVDLIYTTAVSDYSRKLLRNKRISKYVTLLATKEEEREVYKISVGEYIKENIQDRRNYGKIYKR